MSAEEPAPPKRSLRETSARSLLVLSGILALVGVVVISPVGGVGLLATAGLLALIALAIGGRRGLAAGAIVVVVIGALAASRFPEARRDYARYLERAEGAGAAAVPRAAPAN